MEKTTVTKELPAPSWWKDWYAKRRKLIKGLKASMRRKGRWGTTLEIRIDGDRHLLDEFRLNTFIRGDAVSLILSNMIIDDIEMGYKGMVQPFKYPEDQTTITVDGP